MHIVECGSGPPLVVIPGLQGRWEYVRPTVDALAESFRVVTFSLGDEPSADWRFNPGRGMDGFADQVGAALDDRGITQAAICGSSFGGLVALRFAARDADRVSALIMVSTPGPGWHLTRRHEFYARLPRVFGPLFLAESPWRLRRELTATLPEAGSRLRFAGQQLRTAIEAPVSVSRMAARARLVATHNRQADGAALACPTLVVHGDPALDHVVDAGGTRDYLALIRGARAAVLDGTGHLGSLTRPREFATIVRAFLISAREGSHDSAA